MTAEATVAEGGGVLRKHEEIYQVFPTGLKDTFLFEGKKVIENDLEDTFLLFFTLAPPEVGVPKSRVRVLRVHKVIENELLKSFWEGIH